MVTKLPDREGLVDADINEIVVVCDWVEPLLVPHDCRQISA